MLFLIYSTEPTAKSEGATKKTAMLVSVQKVKKGSFIPEFVATGTVQPLEDVRLNAQVSGQIIERSPEFVPGGLVKKGEVLLKINPADYRNQLELRKSELLQAKTDLEVEMGRQNIAKKDLALVGGDSISGKQKDLVLRQPQLKAVKARVQSARASVNQARLNLKRTSVEAPFDAKVIEQNVTLGSQVSTQSNLGRLVGIDYFWVNITLPLNKVQWLSFPKNDSEKGAEVRIKNTTSRDTEEYRTGYLYREIGALDRQTRLARILIRVKDPLANKKSNQGKPKLTIGEFVETQIQAEKIDDVVQLDREFLRGNKTVWVMEDGKLAIRDVKIKLMDANYAYITDGLRGNENVVTSNISTVTNGVLLRTEKDSVQ